MQPAGSSLLRKVVGNRVTGFIFRPRPVRKLLILMALALLAPALGFSSYLVARFAATQRDQIEQRLVQVAGDLADNIDRDIERMLALLDTLALSQLLLTRDYAAFHSQATEAVKRLGAHVLVVDASMQQHLNTRVPYGMPLPQASDPTLPEAIEKGKDVQISNVFIGGVARVPVFNLIKSLAAQGQPGMFLVLAVDASHILPIMSGMKLPPVWVTGVTDRTGRIVARSADNNAYVGTLLPAILRDPSRIDGHTFTTINIKGEPSVRAITTSKLTNWLVSANLPRSALDADIRRSMMMLVTGGLTLLALAGALASTFANWIIGPLQKLAQSSGKLEAGGMPPLLSSPVEEANDIAAALHAASVELKDKAISLRESETRLELAQKTAGLAYVDINFARKTMTASETFEQILGVTLRGKAFDAGLSNFLQSVHPADQKHVRQSYHDTIGKIGAFQYDFRTLRPNGSIAWITAQGETFVDDFGRPTRTLITCLDVTGRREQEDHIRFLLREVSHRSKNLLAIVQAMATQTAKSSPSFQAFQSRFSQRLQGMAASQDLLVNQNWDGVDIGALTRAQLRPFADETGGRLSITGQRILLKPEAAQSLGLALHELGTNATKYGALSVSSGKVSISWNVERTGDAPRFLMEWRESGGPMVTPPTQKGFGHIVLERMVGQALGAHVDLKYAPEGFVWSLDTNLDLISD